MFVKEDDIEEQKMAMKVLRLGRKKKEKKTYSSVFKNVAIDISLKSNSNPIMHGSTHSCQ